MPTIPPPKPTPVAFCPRFLLEPGHAAQQRITKEKNLRQENLIRGLSTQWVGPKKEKEKNILNKKAKEGKERKTEDKKKGEKEKRKRKKQRIEKGMKTKKEKAIFLWFSILVYFLSVRALETLYEEPKDRHSEKLKVQV